MRDERARGPTAHTATLGRERPRGTDRRKREERRHRLRGRQCVAAAKLVAGLLTGSSAMLAEAIHSTADSINVVLLGVSLRRSRRPPDAEHPLGHGRERFMWALLAAVSSFVIGGCVSVALAIHELSHGSDLEDLYVAGIVLAVAALADGASLRQTLREARREAGRWGVSTFTYLRYTSEPTLRAIAVEDTAALVGVALAAAGLLVHALGGPAESDAIASLLIGLLLMATAVGLARPLTDLLVGTSIPPSRLERGVRDPQRGSGHRRGPDRLRGAYRAAGGAPRREGAYDSRSERRGRRPRP